MLRDAVRFKKIGTLKLQRALELRLCTCLVWSSGLIVVYFELVRHVALELCIRLAFVLWRAVAVCTHDRVCLVYRLALAPACFCFDCPPAVGPSTRDFSRFRVPPMILNNFLWDGPKMGRGVK